MSLMKELVFLSFGRYGIAVDVGGSGSGKEDISHGTASSSVQFLSYESMNPIPPELVIQGEAGAGAVSLIIADEMGYAGEGVGGNCMQPVEMSHLSADDECFLDVNNVFGNTLDAWTDSSVNIMHPTSQISLGMLPSSDAAQPNAELPETVDPQSSLFSDGWTCPPYFLEEWAQEFAQPDGWAHLPASAVAWTSPYPEIPLLRILGEEKRRRFGDELDVTDPFFISYARYHQCYEVPHWEIPSARTMKRIAKQSMFTLTHHLPIIHPSQSRLEQIHPGLAFAMMIVGSPRHASIAGDFGRKWWLQPGDGDVARLADRREWEEGRSVISPWTDSEVEVLEFEPLEEERTFEEAKPRANGYDELTTNIFHARSARIMEPDITWRYTTVWKDVSGSPDHVLRTQWKRWIEEEARRRTIWLLYLFDTLKIVETRGSGLILPQDVGGLLLPSPDSIWKTGSHAQWREAMVTYTPVTLDEAMEAHFADSDMPVDATGKSNSSCLFSHLGRFARLLIVLTLLRGLTLFGEGKSDAGSLLNAWGVLFHNGSPNNKNMSTVLAFGSALSTVSTMSDSER
ncbi:hypothetical protein QFC22_005623 [Naganishia vaughanmartiniae]|uniref:Uncharacterized protein n=1 Tax=Naganishia vaughanmartiniae TaxID=1424756 RepID=A0ACC2WUN4_9TREE|nr:hypothetical protein QFC22_005623 [Naganishia vaughanmartiniae]